ncbi:MAG: GNAT family N-acetyltransferase [Anaerocolumna sp.]
MFNYRMADLEDTDILAHLRVLMLSDGIDLTEEYKDRLLSNTKQYMKNGFMDKSYEVLVAEFNGEIIAMSGLTFYILPPNEWCPGGKTAYIGGIYTMPVFRRQGIASELLSRSVEEAKRLGCERIQLHTTDMGRPIYEKYGFEDSLSSMAYFPFGKAGITQ